MAVAELTTTVAVAAAAVAVMADDALDPARWMPPTNLRFTCELCGGELLGLEGISEHLEAEHGYTSERWSDGGLVLDTSALLDGDTA